MLRLLLLSLLIGPIGAAVPGPASDPAFGVPFGGEVTGVTYDDAHDRIYIGGTFSAWRQPDGAGGWVTSPRLGLCVLSRDGVLLPAAATVAGGSFQMQIIGSTLFLFGNFSSVNGVPRARIAALSTIDHSLLPFDAHVVGFSVNHGVVVGDTLYFGGDFTEVGGQPRQRLAAVAVDTGALRAWNPGCSGGEGVARLAAIGTTIYISGSFDAVAGTPRHRAAAVSLDGVLMPWNPDASSVDSNARIMDITAAHGVVFVGGFFDHIGGADRARFAALDPITGAAVAGWNLPCDHYVGLLAPTSDGLFVAGGFSQIGGQARNSLAFITAAGSVDPWSPTPTDSYYGMAAGAGGVYGGAGSFYAFRALPGDLAAGQITSLIHLGTDRADRITGYPASAQSILWDEFVLSGCGPEYGIQPSVGVGVSFTVETTEAPMRWTAITGVRRPDDVRRSFLVDDRMSYFPSGVGGGYVVYYGLWATVPSDRTVRIRYHCAGQLQVWMDGASTPIIDASGDVSGLTDDIAFSAGHHRLVLKLFAQSTTDCLALAFEQADSSKSVAQQLLAPGTPVTDFTYPTVDPIAPAIAAFAPADGAVGLATNELIQVTFTEPMDTSLPASLCAVLTPTVAGTWAWADHLHLCFTPAAGLAASTTYALAVDPAHCRDCAGNALASASGFGFTTRAAQAPTLSSVTPAVVEAAPFSATVAGSDLVRGAIARLPGWSTRGGSRYVLVSPGDDWIAAQQHAVAVGGHLATIGDAGEDAAVWRFLGRANGWIGAVDLDNDETFAWVDGTPFTYSNWAPGEPNSFGGEAEDRGIYWWGLQWNDVSSSPDAVRPYVIEFDAPSPPRVVLRRAGSADVECTVSWDSSNALTISADATFMALGAWDVIAINAGAGNDSATLVGGLVIRDSIAPTIAISSPAWPDAMGRTPFTFSGIAQDGGHLVTVAWSLTGATVANGTTVGPRWSFTENLGEGLTTITATAVDAAGNSATATASVTLDTIAPTVAFTSPVVAGQTYTTTDAAIDIAGTSSGTAGFLGLIYMLNGATADEGSLSGSGTWSFHHLLSIGSTTVTVVGRDAAGNTSTSSITIVRNRVLPTVTILSPASVGAFTTDADRVTVSGTASSGSFVTVVSYELSGATIASGLAAGTTSWSFDIPSLAVGATTVTVTGHDSAGNTNSAVLIISRGIDVVPPTIVATSFVISGVLPSGATALRIDGAPGGSLAAVVDPVLRTWTATVPAPTVTTQLTLVVSDGVGESTSTMTIHPLVDLSLGGGG